MQQAGRWIGGDPMNDSRNLSGPILMPGATAAAEVCQECGLDWNVSKQAVIPWYGYKCPICRSKYRKGAKP